jgi:hypothetical protein
MHNSDYTLIHLYKGHYQDLVNQNRKDKLVNECKAQKFVRPVRRFIRRHRI